MANLPTIYFVGTMARHKDVIFCSKAVLENLYLGNGITEIVENLSVLSILRILAH